MRKYKIVFVCFLLSTFLFTSIDYAKAEGGSSPTTDSSTVQLKIPTDIIGSQAEEYIKRALTAGYVKAYDDKTFKPDAKVTREEFLAMMVDALDIPTEQPNGTETSFTPILNAAVKGNLYQDDYRLKWSDPITLSDAALTLERATHQASYARIVKSSTTQSTSTTSLKNSYPEYAEDLQILQSFKDLNVKLDDYDNPKVLIQAITEWYSRKQDEFMDENSKQGKNYCIPTMGEANCVNPTDQKIYPVMERYKSFLQRLAKFSTDLSKTYDGFEPKQRVYESVRRGLIQGSGQGKLALDSSITRAQAVVYIERALSYNKGNDLPVDKYALELAEVYWHQTNIFTKWSNYLGIENSSKFDTSKLPYESKYYKGAITGLYIIDLDDPKDPFWDKLQYPLKDLYRDTWAGNRAFPLTKSKDAYLIVYTQTKNQFKSKVDLQLIISGVGEGHLNDGGMTKERQEQMSRVAKGSFEVQQNVVRKINNLKPGMPYKDYEGMPAEYTNIKIVPKKNIKVEDSVTIYLTTGVVGDTNTNQRVMNIRPDHIKNLPPESVLSNPRGFYLLDQLN
ncbi:hypothetical protein GCM10008013_03000 [Paenibacillus segetis]|uniref:SLH domain-containing protein n=1 Tax=Paenibacillus segetis TaxID=1325360 RepID=A0ABQ1Y3Z4_9BACL|nr:hypothetical protein GCM10008013_03000 [Paenibacillus segetis]